SSGSLRPSRAAARTRWTNRSYNSSFLTSHQVEQSKNKHPDQVDKVPVEAGELDTLRPRAPQGRSQGQDDEDDQAGEHVRAVESRDEEEVGAEVRHAPGIAIEPGAGLDERGPFPGLHAEKRQAAQDRQKYEAQDQVAAALPRGAHGGGHGGAARNQGESHQGDEVQVEDG